MRLGEGQHPGTKNLPTFDQKRVYTFIKRTGEMAERELENLCACRCCRFLLVCFAGQSLVHANSYTVDCRAFSGCSFDFSLEH